MNYGYEKIIFSSPLTLSREEFLDLPATNVIVPESWYEVLTKTRICVLPNDLMIVW